MKKFKKVFCTIALLGTSISGICSSNQNNYNVFIQESFSNESQTINRQGAEYGFYINEDEYDVTWNEAKIVSAYYNNKIIGKTFIYQGKAVYKDEISMHNDEYKYIIYYLTAVRTCPLNASYSENVLWWTNYWTEYGYNNKCEINAKVVEGSKYINTFPKFYGQKDSYSVGYSYDVYGKVNFESGALEVSNDSHKDSNIVDIKINLKESNMRNDWKRYEYAQQKNIQLFAFSVLTISKDIKQTITINTEYGTMDANANYWKNTFNHYADCSCIVTI